MPAAALSSVSPSPWPRRLAWSLAALVATLLALGLALAALVLERSPLVPAAGEVTHEDVARTLALLRAQDPRRAGHGGPHVVTLGERDLDLLVNHAARRLVPARVAVRLERGAAELGASAALPAGWWLNLRLRLREAAGRPEVEAVRLGRLPLPAAPTLALATTLLPRLLSGSAAGSNSAAELVARLERVQRVSFHPGRMSVVYRWEPGTARSVLAALLTPDEEARLRRQLTELGQLVNRHAAGSSVALAELLAPLLRAAGARAGSDDDEAAAETRAALIALVLYAGRIDLERLLPRATPWPRPTPLHVTLSGRGDLALHFLVSAVIALDATSPLSRAVGLHKEVADARGGSGFSFPDLAADRAGTRLGELARSAPRTVLERLAAGTDDAALMPAWRDLPEGLSEAEFKRRFGDVGAPEYARLLAEIDGRIAALPVLR